MGLEDQQLAKKRHHKRDLVGEPGSTVCADAKGINELHAVKGGCPEETTKTRQMQELRYGGA